MLKQDRFLTGILIGIAVLVLVVIGVFIIRGDQQTYIDDDTPQGIVHNYVLALQNRNFEKAYSYLPDLDHKPDYESFRQEFMRNRSDITNMGLKVGQVQYRGDEAYVEVFVMEVGNGPFSDPYEYTETASLVKQDDAWKINYMPYPFWMWDWYAKPPVNELRD